MKDGRVETAQGLIDNMMMTVLEAVMMMAFVMSRRRCRRKEKSDVLLSNVVALRIFVVTSTCRFYCILNINIAGASKMSLKGKVV